MKSNFSVREALQWGIEKLKRAGVKTPVLDTELLLAHSAILRNRRIDRAWLHAHPEQHIGRTAGQHFAKFVQRRARREPVAYILGHKEFYGLEFLVNKNVLIPRPETEILVELAFEEIKNVKCKIKNEIAVVDVGTGSGAIAVAVAKECKIKNVECKIFATDISPQALRIAQQNTKRHGVKKQIKFFKGNLLEPLENVILNACRRRQAVKDPAQDMKYGILRAAQNDILRELIVVANLPYLPTEEWRGAMPEVRKFEPRGALDGGKDGLKYYRELFDQVSGVGDQASVTVLCEICPEQAGAFQKMVREFFPRAKIKVIKDLAGRNRAVKVTF